MSNVRRLPALSELARPGRRALVPRTMTDFHGPTSGVVELPHRMFWQADRRFNLNEQAQPHYDTWLAQREAA